MTQAERITYTETIARAARRDEERNTKLAVIYPDLAPYFLRRALDARIEAHRAEDEAHRLRAGGRPSWGV